MFKDKTNPFLTGQLETVEDFLARGGKIDHSAKRKSKKKSKKINAQDLLDAATSPKEELEIIAFLKTQGIEVEG